MGFVNARKAVVPTPAEIELAKKGAEKITALQAKPRQSKKFFITDGTSAKVELSGPAFDLLAEAIKEIAHGKAVALMPVDAELTTQQAADLLNVSRPYFVNLLTSGEIPCRHVGRYRRVRYQDLLHYRQKSERQSKAAMDELVAQAQELGMGY